MKRLLTIGVFATVALLIVRMGFPKLHERLEARCKAMFEKMSSPQPGCCGQPSDEVTVRQTERDADRAELVAAA